MYYRNLIRDFLRRNSGRKQYVLAIAVLVLIFGPIWMPSDWLQDALVILTMYLLVVGSYWYAKKYLLPSAKEDAKPPQQNNGLAPPTNDTPTVVLPTMFHPSTRVFDLTAEQFLALMKEAAVVRPEKQDDTLYWRKNPHIKHFLKRLWRIVVCWAAIGVVISSLFASMYWAYAALSSFALILFGSGYTFRRYKKWRDLYIVVRGDWVLIQEAKSRWFFLNGQRQAIPVLACNNMVTMQTNTELFLQLDCGKLSIDTPIDKDDKFKNLEDVRDFEELEALLKRLYSEALHRAGVLPM